MRQSHASDSEPTGGDPFDSSSRIRALIALHGDVDTEIDPYLDDGAIGIVARPIPGRDAA
jgi:hypothetical protein